MENLDLKCAELGRGLAELQADSKNVDEKVFNSALSVLEEQGPYACFLYLQGRVDKVGRKITEEATTFLRSLLDGNKDSKEPLEFIQDLASDLDRLLFARDLLRQGLVYGRYHAKAKEAKA
jgi:hypothetical protein